MLCQVISLRLTGLGQRLLSGAKESVGQFHILGRRLHLNDVGRGNDEGD